MLDDNDLPEVWDCSDEEDDFGCTNTNEYSCTSNEHQDTSQRISSTHSLIKFVVIFLLLWQAIFRISNIAVDVLFKFIGVLLHKFGEFTDSIKLKQFADCFPNTMLKGHKFQAINRDDYQKLVVCGRCNCTYEYDDCLKDTTGKRNNAKCSFVRFPRHPQTRMRSPCETPLLKLVKTSSHKYLYKPIKVICYRSVIKSIQEYVQHEQYVVLFNHWKQRVGIPLSVMADIYDGTIWQSFQNFEGQDFLSNKYSFGLMLNVDWFNPFKHVEYSVGAMYLAILNFPRHLRYKKENMTLVGIIPGPREPSLHMNSYLEPVVRELLQLWKGIEMVTPDRIQTVRAALLCTASDIPATRKLGGFVGNGALKGAQDV